jgi:hypothetical protein
MNNLSRIALALCVALLAGCSPAKEESSVSESDNSPSPAADVRVNLPADRNQLNGWVLEQSNSVGGNGTLYLCPAACRLKNTDRGVSYVVTAADWKVYVYNDSRKLVYQTTFDVLMKQRPAQEGDGISPYQKGSTAKIAGFNATQYLSKATIEGDHGKQENITELWFTAEIDLPVKFSELQVQTRKGLPERGVLLRAEITEEGEKTTILDTTSVKKEALDPSVFQVPSGFAAAASEGVVTMGEVEGEALQNIYEGLGKSSADSK